MNKKSIVVTCLAAALILTAGSFLPVLLDKAFFDAEAVVEDESSVRDQLEESTESFLDGFWYPLKEKTDPLSAEAREYFRADSQALSSDIYERIFASAGLSYEDEAWENPEQTEGEEFVILRGEAAKNDKKYRLHLAAKNNLPVLYWLENPETPTGEQIQEAVETLEQYIEGAGEVLRSFVRQIDEIYGDSEEYRREVLRIYGQTGDAGETNEKVSLWDCCLGGEWQVYTGSGRVVLACVVGTESVVFYYDAAKRTFCGYNLAVNRSSFA